MRFSRSLSTTVATDPPPVDGRSALITSPPARTSRSTCSPLRRLSCPVTSTTPTSSVTGPAHVDEFNPAPAKAAASVPATRTGTGTESTATRSSRQPLSNRSGRLLGTTLPTSLIAAGITTVSPKRRSRVVRSVTAAISIVTCPALNPSGTSTAETPPSSAGGTTTSTVSPSWVNLTTVTSE